MQNHTKFRRKVETGGGDISGIFFSLLVSDFTSLSMLPHLQKQKKKNLPVPGLTPRLGKNVKKEITRSTTHLNPLSLCSEHYPLTPALPPQHSCPCSTSIESIRASQLANSGRQLKKEELRCPWFMSTPNESVIVCVSVQIGECVTCAEYIPHALFWSWNRKQCM